MKNSHDEIKGLLRASRKMLTNEFLQEDIQKIKQKYNLITEQDVNLTSGNVTDKTNVMQSIEDTIEDEETPKKDRKQAYRISGGLIVLHGKDKNDLELTTDEKAAFQETMEEFVTDVSDLTDFNKLNVFPNNVEWSGKIIDFDLDFYFSIGEENGIYINAEMIRTDDEFLELINKLKQFYLKFKSKWSKIISMRKRTEY
jgi:hypothetical protein